MAEQRFPSIEDFSEDTPIPSAPVGSDAANEQSFLDRERAALGDDADFFATPGDTKLARVEDDDDLLGGDESYQQNNNAEELEFEQNFPAVDQRNAAVGPGGTITGAQGFTQHAYSTYPGAAQEEEPEVIKAWRERRDLALNDRAEVAAEKKSKTISAARENIDEFYESYNNKKDKSIAQTRKEAEEFLANRDDTTAGGTSWQRISKLVDLGGKGSSSTTSAAGKEKFRDLLTSLRKDEKAPGASGV